MNFEALSLFQHTTIPSPLEQQQAMGEFKDIISSTADISCIEAEIRGDQFAGDTHAFSGGLGPSHRSGTEGISGDSFGEEAPRRSQPTPIPTPSTAGHSFYHPPHRDSSLAESQRLGPESAATSRRSRTSLGVGLKPPILPLKDKEKNTPGKRSGVLRSSRVP